MRETSRVEVLSVEAIAAADLLAALRQVPLRDGVSRPYASASLSLEVLAPDDLVPAQNYVLRPGVDRAGRLREALAPHGVDPLALGGAALVTTSDDPGEQVPLLPPVVEESAERDGTTVLLVADGMHRVWLARRLGLGVEVVVVRGVDPQWPYYAYPLPDGWAGVEELDALQPGRQKKDYRQPQSYKALFRDYNAVFPGVQQERPDTNPSHLRA